MNLKGITTTRLDSETVCTFQIAPLFVLLSRLVQKNFVEVVRAAETLLSVWTLDTNSSSVLLDNLLSNTTNMTVSLLAVADYGGAVGKTMVDAAPLLAEAVSELGVSGILTQSSPPSTSSL